MKSYVTDTHTLIWHMMQSRKLSSGARRAFQDAEQGMAQILVPTIVLVESAFIFARNRIPRDILDRVFALSDERDANFRIVPLDWQSLMRCWILVRWQYLKLLIGLLLPRHAPTICPC